MKRQTKQQQAAAAIANLEAAYDRYQLQDFGTIQNFKRVYRPAIESADRFYNRAVLANAAGDFELAIDNANDGFFVLNLALEGAGL